MRRTAAVRNRCMMAAFLVGASAMHAHWLDVPDCMTASVSPGEQMQRKRQVMAGGRAAAPAPCPGHEPSSARRRQVLPVMQQSKAPVRKITESNSFQVSAEQEAGFKVQTNGKSCDGELLGSATQELCLQFEQVGKTRSGRASSVGVQVCRMCR